MHAIRWIGILIFLSPMLTGCFDLSDLPLGASCETESTFDDDDDDDEECAGQMRCLQLFLPDQEGMCGGASTNICTQHCNDDDDCAELGDDVVCTNTCGQQRVCAALSSL